jgi:predicted phosphodiesterase
MSRYVVLSDVHANLEALKAVLEDIRKQDVKGAWFLGDLVSYGPDPEACVHTLLEELACPLTGVRGNNDQIFLDGVPETDFNLVTDLVASTSGFQDSERETRISATHQSHQWTYDTLSQEALTLLEEQLKEPVGGQPLAVDGAVLMHASPCDPIGMEGNYLRTAGDAEEAFVCYFTVVREDADASDIKDFFTKDTFRIGFFGHTHHAGVFRQTTTERIYKNVEHIPVNRVTFTGNVYEFNLDDRRVLINPGSVGQPRDGDHRAAYAIYDTDEQKVEFHRVPYSFEPTIQKLEAIGEKRNNLIPMVDLMIQRLKEAG